MDWTVLKRRRQNHWTSDTGYPFASRSPAAALLFRTLFAFLTLWIGLYAFVALAAVVAGMSWAGLIVPLLLAVPLVKLLLMLEEHRGPVFLWMYCAALLSAAAMTWGVLWIGFSLRDDPRPEAAIQRVQVSSSSASATPSSLPWAKSWTT